MNVIEIRNVTKDYGDFKLDHVSFEVPEGSVCGFIGQNGAYIYRQLCLKN